MGLPHETGQSCGIYQDHHRDGGNDGFLEVQGNPAGYLQLGVAFLQAAYAPAAGASSLDGDAIYVECLTL